MDCASANKYVTNAVSAPGLRRIPEIVTAPAVRRTRRCANATPAATDRDRGFRAGRAAGLAEGGGRGLVAVLAGAHPADPGARALRRPSSVRATPSGRPSQSGWGAA